MFLSQKTALQVNPVNGLVRCKSAWAVVMLVPLRAAVLPLAAVMLLVAVRSLAAAGLNLPKACASELHRSAPPFAWGQAVTDSAASVLLVPRECSNSLLEV